jgi:ankyrin repeat protein
MSAKTVEKAKKDVEKQLLDLLRTAAGNDELSEADLNHSSSDVCDNIWDMYLDGGVAEVVSSEREVEAVRRFYNEAFDRLLPKVLAERAKEKKKPAKKKDATQEKQAKLDEELLVAVSNYQWKKVKKLVEQGANIDAVNPAYDETALHAALHHGEHALAKWLIERGADIHIARVGDSTPLCVAARQSLEIAKMLVERGGVVDESVLANAVSDAEMMAFLIGKMKKSVKLTGDALGEAIQWVDRCVREKDRKGVKAATESARLLLARGTSADAIVYDEPALVLAAASGSVELVELLLDAGAKIDKAKGKRTALKAATEEKHAAVVKLLTARGAKK